MTFDLELQKYDAIKGDNGQIRGKEAECAKLFGLKWNPKDDEVTKERFRQNMFSSVKLKRIALENMEGAKAKDGDSEAIFSKFAADTRKARINFRRR